MFTSNSTEVVWWKCSFCSNEWIASIDNRTRDRGCPNCKKRSKTSFPEQAIVYYLRNHFADIVNGYQGIFKNTSSELDIYIPSRNVGIEYDGLNHKNPGAYERDKDKYLQCIDHGVTLYRIREDPEEHDSELCDVLISSKYDTSRFAAVDEYMRELFSKLGLHESLDEIDCSRDKNAIRSLYYERLNKNSLGEMHPKIAEEWHPTLNYPLTPAMISYGTGDEYWWKCSKCGHEWEAAVNSRVKGSGCKICGYARSGKAHSRAIIDIDTNEVFNSMRETSEKTGISETSIREVCCGEKESVKGRRFRYLN